MCNNRIYNHILLQHNHVADDDLRRRSSVLDHKLSYSILCAD